jgi:TM2 domain-containing membrane protein YozV
LALSLFLGYFGVDRFYIGNIVLGILKLITVGGFFIWMLVDWFLIMDATRKANFKIANEVRRSFG